MAVRNSSGAHATVFCTSMMFRESHARPSIEARLLVVAVGLFLAAVAWELAVAHRQATERRRETANQAAF